MATKARFQAIKGTRDLLPPETELWNRVEATAREVFSTFAFGEIRLPIFEPTELFARAVGGETDIVSKEMFLLKEQYEDPTSIDLARRRDLLVGLAVSSADTRTTGFFSQEIQRFRDDYEAALKKGLVYQSDSAAVGLDHLKDSISRLVDEIPEVPGNPDWQGRFDKAVIFCKENLAHILLEPTSVLRPEATASVCRAYIEHNVQQWPAPVKLYYMGPMFRRERPQKGRYRQFYQIGAEVLGGTDAPGIDAEVIEMVMTFFARLELPGVQLEINSIGHSAPNCRRGYVEKLRAALLEVKDKLGADSQRRIETNPLRVLDSKLEHEQAIIRSLPKIGDSLCDECKVHYAEVKRQLGMRGVAFRENWRLVRGLDYYMRTTFEITAQGLGSQNAVCGGGRYDGLVELLGGPPTKGIGFAIGEDRLVLSLLEAEKEAALRSSGQASSEWRAAKRCDVYVAWMGKNSEATAIRAARMLREAGLRVELPAAEQKFGKALGQADKLGAKFALILGEDEVASSEWTVKSLAEGKQEKVKEGEVVEFLRSK